MTNRDLVIFLPGGGATDEELAPLKTIVEADGRFRMVSFPGWRRYASNEFSADLLIGEVAAYVESEAPTGPLRIVGLSLGAHVGYAAAVRLQSRGREVVGFCAIDGTMSGYPWRQGLQLLKERQFRVLWATAMAKARHSLIRLRGTKGPLHAKADSDVATPPSLVLWLASARTWTLSLDFNPVPLNASNALVRTRPSAADDKVWKRRCPGIRILQVPGTHHTFMDSQHINSFRLAMATAICDWR